MKKQIISEEFKRMQKLAGVLNESTLKIYRYDTSSYKLKDVKTKQLSGGITDEKGNFSINTPKGTYDVSFEHISFKTVTMPNKLIDKSINFGVIKLAEDSKKLDEIVNLVSMAPSADNNQSFPKISIRGSKR